MFLHGIFCFLIPVSDASSLIFTTGSDPSTITGTTPFCHVSDIITKAGDPTTGECTFPPREGDNVIGVRIPAGAMLQAYFKKETS